MFSRAKDLRWSNGKEMKKGDGIKQRLITTLIWISLGSQGNVIICNKVLSKDVLFLNFSDNYTINDLSSIPVLDKVWDTVLIQLPIDFDT